MNTYIYTQIIRAESLVKDGQPGFDIYGPNGERGWLTEDEFKIHCRPVDRRERVLLQQSEAELGVMGVSDVGNSPN